MQIIYVGPFSAVRFFDQGEEREVAQGEAVEVHPDTAGRAPAARLTAALAELAAAGDDDELAAKLRFEIAGLDAGAGLLAQPTNWQPAPAAKSKTTAKDGE